MNARERICAVLHREEPDQVPWIPYDNLVPRGAFERELRNKGMGLCCRRRIVGIAGKPTPIPNVIASYTGDVICESRTEGNITTVYIRTPVGTLSQRIKTFPGKQLRYNPRYRSLDPLIKTEADFDVAIYLLDNIEYYVDEQDYLHTDMELGKDGIVRGEGFGPPYDATKGFFGFGGSGLSEWFAAQMKYPHEFDKLLRACERQRERMLPFILDSSAEFISMGSTQGWYGPRQWEKYCLPFFQKYTHIFHKKGKIISHHAHADNLKAVKHLIAKSGFDVIEAFTPPPVGNLSIAEAREAWGDDIIIWVNFPETIFYNGAEYTKKYAKELIESDPARNRLVFGLTEMGAEGITDDQTEIIFKAGLRAVTDAINEYGKLE